MTVNELSFIDSVQILSMPSPDREISGVYVGDLLSWVMSKASADNAWLTIMSNVNIVAVAALTDVSLIILTEGVTLDDEILSVAKSKEVNVFSSSLSTYELSVKLHDLLK